MKIVVMGGSGLIGAKTVAILRGKGHEAIAASPRSGVNSVTGAGLNEALRDAQVVIDVSNAPSWAPDDVMAFFRTSTTNLVKAEAAAGVQHHVALSVVGTDRMPDNGYFLAKAAQEELIAESGMPYSIVRATQFMEFLGGIADAGMQDGKVHLSTGQFQPIAADDVAAIVADVALAAPINGIVDIAGPERAPLHRIVGQYLKAQGDAREVVADPKATYFGGTIEEDSLVPTGVARRGSIALEDWLKQARP
ncbi:NmrA family transcriptional regulator [Caballeronia novacaledonica]|uniref:NmrA family transcriptional regulator n=1 Tax=Caballeronia novacaledonica TaxID=1544861 RepID=A0A2U3I5J3_9BURK|nr:SDR family oxidoreductase [Caballeronia novacaledonica]SPB15420.1 NmrA family transcriptional regulator [Caballeronia novacaledonica]